MKRFPDEPVCVSVAGLPWHPACMQQAQTVPDTETSHPHHKYTQVKRLFSPHVSEAEARSLQRVWTHIQLLGSNANSQPASLQRRRMRRERTACGLNLLMSRLPLTTTTTTPAPFSLENRLLIQIHTPMPPVNTTSLLSWGPNAPASPSPLSFSLCCHIADLQVLLEGGRGCGGWGGGTDRRGLVCLFAVVV